MCVCDSVDELRGTYATANGGCSGPHVLSVVPTLLVVSASVAVEVVELLLGVPIVDGLCGHAEQARAAFNVYVLTLTHNAQQDVGQR